MDTCKNCGQPVTDLFCSRCGQTARIKRITFRTIWHDIFYFFSHMEKGFWFTTLKLLTDPGVVVKGYISGKRILYQKPVSYYLIWTTIYLLLLNLIEYSFGKETVIYRSHYFGDSETTHLATKYMSIIVGVLVPLFALYLGWAGLSKQLNYTELLTAILFGQGSVLLVQTLYSIFIVGVYALFDSGINSNFSDAIKALYVGWFSYKLFIAYKVKRPLISTMIFTVLSISTYLLYRVYGFSFITSVIA